MIAFPPNSWSGKQRTWKEMGHSYKLGLTRFNGLLCELFHFFLSGPNLLQSAFQYLSYFPFFGLSYFSHTLLKFLLYLVSEEVNSVVQDDKLRDHTHD